MSERSRLLYEQVNETRKRASNMRSMAVHMLEMGEVSEAIGAMTQAHQCAVELAKLRAEMYHARLEASLEWLRNGGTLCVRSRDNGSAQVEAIDDRAYNDPVG